MSAADWISTSVPYLAPGGADLWAAEAAAVGRQGSQRIVYAGEVAAPREVAAVLGQSEGDPLVVRRRVMLLDDHPHELTDTYYPAYIARGTRLAETRKIPSGAVSLLAELGYRGARVREDVTARLPTRDEQQALLIGADQPVLCLTRLTLDDQDRRIQADVIVMSADRRRLRYELKIG